MSSYLEEAAVLLRKAAVENEKTRDHHGVGRPQRQIDEGRHQIVAGFALLAAIDKGILPVTMAEDLMVRSLFRQDAPA